MEPLFDCVPDYVNGSGQTDQDLHLINLYIQQMSNMLRPGGFGFFSVANIASELGWARFSKQTDFSVSEQTGQTVLGAMGLPIYVCLYGC